MRCIQATGGGAFRYVVSYDMEFYLITIFRKASRLVKQGLQSSP
jgi:hypothetical protein